MTRATVRLGYGVALVLGMVGVALRVVPVSVPDATVEAPEPYRVPDPPSGTEQAATLLSFQEIVTANLFAQERTAGDERYTPPELVAADTPAPEPPPDANPRWRFRLYGTAVGPEGGVALIDADPTIPGAEVYRVGDRVGAARLVEIQETAVVLDGTAGLFTLTLPSSMRRLP